MLVWCSYVRDAPRGRAHERCVRKGWMADATPALKPPCLARVAAGARPLDHAIFPELLCAETLAVEEDSAEGNAAMAMACTNSLRFDCAPSLVMEASVLSRSYASYEQSQRALLSRSSARSEAQIKSREQISRRCVSRAAALKGGPSPLIGYKLRFFPKKVPNKASTNYVRRFQAHVTCDSAQSREPIARPRLEPPPGLVRWEGELFVTSFMTTLGESISDDRGLLLREYASFQVPAAQNPG